MFCTIWAVRYWLFFVLCFTSEYLVALSNESNNATKIPSTITTEDTRTLSVEPTLADTTLAGHKLRCTEAERQRVGCLNGGECFAVELNPRVAACVCQPGWEGARCQFMELPPDLWEASSLIGLIVGLVAGVAAVIISLLFFFYWKKKQSRPDRRRSLELSLNGVQSHSIREEDATEPLKEVDNFLFQVQALLSKTLPLFDYHLENHLLKLMCTYLPLLLSFGFEYISTYCVFSRHLNTYYLLSV